MVKGFSGENGSMCRAKYLLALCRRQLLKSSLLAGHSKVRVSLFVGM